MFLNSSRIAHNRWLTIVASMLSAVIHGRKSFRKDNLHDYVEPCSAKSQAIKAILPTEMGNRTLQPPTYEIWTYGSWYKMLNVAQGCAIVKERRPFPNHPCRSVKTVHIQLACFVLESQSMDTTKRSSGKPVWCLTNSNINGAQLYHPE